MLICIWIDSCGCSFYHCETGSFNRSIQLMSWNCKTDSVFRSLFVSPSPPWDLSQVHYGRLQLLPACWGGRRRPRRVDGARLRPPAVARHGLPEEQPERLHPPTSVQSRPAPRAQVREGLFHSFIHLFTHSFIDEIIRWECFSQCWMKTTKKKIPEGFSLLLIGCGNTVVKLRPLTPGRHTVCFPPAAVAKWSSLSAESNKMLYSSKGKKEKNLKLKSSS